MENIMAAVAMARSVGVPMEKIRETITSFMGVEHRIEYVTTKKASRITMIPKARIPTRP